MDASLSHCFFLQLLCYKHGEMEVGWECLGEIQTGVICVTLNVGGEGEGWWRGVGGEEEVGVVLMDSIKNTWASNKPRAWPQNHK